MLNVQKNSERRVFDLDTPFEDTPTPSSVETSTPIGSPTASNSERRKSNYKLFGPIKTLTKTNSKLDLQSNASGTPQTSPQQKKK